MQALTPAVPLCYIVCYLASLSPGGVPYWIYCLPSLLLCGPPAQTMLRFLIGHRKLEPVSTKDLPLLPTLLAPAPLIILCHFFLHTCCKMEQWLHLFRLFTGRELMCVFLRGIFLNVRLVTLGSSHQLRVFDMRKVMLVVKKCVSSVVVIFNNSFIFLISFAVLEARYVSSQVVCVPRVCVTSIIF